MTQHPESKRVLFRQYTVRYKKSGGWPRGLLISGTTPPWRAELCSLGGYSVLQVPGVWAILPAGGRRRMPVLFVRCLQARASLGRSSQRWVPRLTWRWGSLCSLFAALLPWLESLRRRLHCLWYDRARSQRLAFTCLVAVWLWRALRAGAGDLQAPGCWRSVPPHLLRLPLPQVRRSRQPPVDLEKEACKRPKVDKKKVRVRRRWRVQGGKEGSWMQFGKLLPAANPLAGGRLLPNPARPRAPFMLVCFPANCRHTAHTSCPTLRPPRLAWPCSQPCSPSRAFSPPRPPAAKERGKRRAGGQGWAHLHAQARRGHHGACKAQGRQARAAGGGSRGGGSQEAAAGGRRRRRGGSSGRRRRQRVMHQELLRCTHVGPPLVTLAVCCGLGGLVYEACCTGDRSRCLGAVLHPGGTCQVPTAGEHAVHSGEERGLRTPQVLANILTNKVKREPVLHSPSNRPIPGGQEPGGGWGSCQHPI